MAMTVGADAPLVGSKTEEPARAPAPDVREISIDDLTECIVAGVRDFRAEPLFGFFFGGVYAIGGWLIVALIFTLDIPYVAYPCVMGFALVSPLVATGSYEVSRRLERHEPLTWSGVLGSVWTRSGKDLGLLALVSAFTLIVWVDFAVFLFLIFYGTHIPSVNQLILDTFTTPTGFLFALVGNGFGAIIAAFVFSITVVSPALLADRDVDFVTAMMTSVRVVRANPVVMFAWAAVIGFCLAASLFTGFLGLFFTLPVLGHTTWRLYRKVVA